MTTKLRYADIMKLRDQYERERQRKRVRIHPDLAILTHALEEYEPIEAHFAGSGGWHQFYAVRIEHGPDHDKVVDLRPWRPAEILEQLAGYYNGVPEVPGAPTAQEYEKTLGYAARPLIERASGGSLHAITVSFLSAKLIEMRLHDMGEHICSLHKQLGD